MKVNQVPCYKFNSKPCSNNCRKATSPVLVQNLEQTNANQGVSFKGIKARRTFVGLTTLGYAVVGFVAGGPVGAIIAGAAGAAASWLLKAMLDEVDGD